MAIGNRCFTDISMNTFNYKGAVTNYEQSRSSGRVWQSKGREKDIFVGFAELPGNANLKSAV